MKHTIRFTAMVVIFSITTTLFSQESKLVTTQFRVKGVCNSCKQRIENAAYIKGVKLCEWNKETELLKIVYNPEKVSIETIHENIAKAGHTTDKVKADSVAYSKLPKCCAYEEAETKH